MKQMIVALSVLMTGFASSAHATQNKVDPRLRGQIYGACRRQMTTLPPERLSQLKVTTRSFCDCVAGEHELDAIKFQRDAADGNAYLKTILSFYATRTADDSAPLRDANRAANDNDETFGTKCNLM